MYLPLDFWKALAADPATTGPRDGRVVTFRNIDRRLSNPQFLALVSDAWIGTTIPQSKLLEQVIEAVLQTGKTITLAVKAAIPPAAVDDDGEGVDTSEAVESEEILEEE